MRCGILTQKERWEKITRNEVYIITGNDLQQYYPPLPTDELLLIDASVLPDNALIAAIQQLNLNQSLSDNNGLIALRIKLNDATEDVEKLIHKQPDDRLITEVKRINQLQDIFLNNDYCTRFDYDLLTYGRNSAAIPDTVQTIRRDNIFIEENASIDYCTINAENGPVYIGKNATIMEGCCIRGPFSIGEGAVLKMGAKIYAATTIGPYCIAGGEIKNSILSAYSNKAHDGYLGDSVIGEWCNMGAGTTNSNVKNTGGIVKLYNYNTKQYLPAGFKCGVIMGDYSRTAINTSINTGTVIGLCCNVFGNGLTPKYIPDFSWGFDTFTAYELEKAIQDINNWKVMKNKTISEKEKSVLRNIYSRIFLNNTI